jgi:hypothetical protein
MDMSKRIGPESLDLSQTILSAQGAQRFFKDWDGEIADRVKYLDRCGKALPIITGHGRAKQDMYALRVTKVPAGRKRQVDYKTMYDQRRDLYSRYVTIVSPDVPYTLTYTKSDLWNGLRSDGWQAVAGKYLADRNATPMRSPKWLAENLSMIRKLRVAQEQREQEARAALATMIKEALGHPEPLEHAGALLRVTTKKPTHKIDLDKAEKMPELRRFIKYTPYAEYEKVEFVYVDPDDEDALY